MKIIKLITCLSIISFSLACMPPQQRVNDYNPLTHGNVQLTLKRGITDKAEVLDTFGAPNITTVDASGREVWTYQRNAMVSQSSSSGSYGTIILFGGSSSASGFEQSSRNMTLIIKFDERNKVYDFKSRSSSF